MNRLDTLLKDSLIALYYDCPEIVYALSHLDYEEVNYKFKSELFMRISPEEFEEVDTYLRSDKYLAYKTAVESASMSITTELAEMIAFVVDNGENKEKN